MSHLVQIQILDQGAGLTHETICLHLHHLNSQTFIQRPLFVFSEHPRLCQGLFEFGIFDPVLPEHRFGLIGAIAPMQLSEFRDTNGIWAQSLLKKCRGMISWLACSGRFSQRFVDRIRFLISQPKSTRLQNRRN